MAHTTLPALRTSRRPATPALGLAHRLASTLGTALTLAAPSASHRVIGRLSTPRVSAP